MKTVLATNEIAFLKCGKGLNEVPNPLLFLASGPQMLPFGVVPLGRTRPILVEIQALVTRQVSDAASDSHRCGL
jgi:predicted ATP-dependent serine protease